MVSVPRFQTAAAIAKQLDLPLQKVSEVLEFLVSRGIAIQDKNRYHVGTKSIHLGNSSPMISKHHANWRLQALRALDIPQASNLHYSSVVSLSREDAAKVRSILVKAIEEVRSVVGPSPEEAVYAYALDLFEVADK